MKVEILETPREIKPRVDTGLMLFFAWAELRQTRRDLLFSQLESRACQGHPPLCLHTIYSLTPLWYRVCGDSLPSFAQIPPPTHTHIVFPGSGATLRNMVLYFRVRGKKCFWPSLCLKQTLPLPLLL